MMKKTMLVVGLMLVCGTVFAQRSLWNRVFGNSPSPSVTPQVQQQDVMPSRTPPEIEMQKNQIEFMATACGEGYYYPSGSKSLQPYASIEWECSQLKEYYNSGKYGVVKDWEGKNITSHYVCLRGYPVPSKPCPDGFEMIGGTSFAAPKVGWPTEAYGCLKTTEPTPEEGITQAPSCPTDLFHSGNASYVVPKDESEWQDPVFKECFKKASAEAWKTWRSGKAGDLPMSQDNKAVKQCAKSGVKFLFWCYANPPKNPEASPCTAKDAKSLPKDMPFNHGACCFFTQ